MSARRSSGAATRPSLAIVLHGRMGGLASLMQGAPPRPLRTFDGALPSLASAALCAASLELHVIAPNRQRYDVDVVGHSWSPEIGAALDGLFSPRRSVHERGIPVGGFRCPNTSFAPSYCHRTLSHLLGITRAMRLKAAVERERGVRYDAVFLSRWDVLWHTPLLQLGARLPGWHASHERRRRTVWLPRICVPVEPGGQLGMALRSGICGGGASAWLATQSAAECAPAARACQGDMTTEARQLYVMDWWLLFGASADADLFAEGVTRDFAAHGARVLARLSSTRGRVVAMGHAWFGAQLVWAMNATLAHVGNIGVDFHLGRAWNERDCLAMRPACARSGGCTGADVRRASWQPSHVASALDAWTATGALAEQRMAPRDVTLPDPRAQMAGSCEQRYLLCKRHSRACNEDEDGSLHPVDRTSVRALYLGCAERTCAELTPTTRTHVDLPRRDTTDADARPAPNSTACAQALLALYLRIAEAAAMTAATTPRLAVRRNATPPSTPFAALNPQDGGRHAAVAARAMASLRARAAGGNPPARDDVCEDAWVRSQGGRRPPIFRRRNATL